MIIPLVLAAAAVLLIGKGASDQHRQALKRRFMHTTLVASSVDGIYDTVEMPNTTKTLTHMLNAVFQNHMSVFVTHDGTKVTFDDPANKAHWEKQGFELFLSSEGLKLRPRS